MFVSSSIAAAMLLGAAFGVLMQRSHFCTMGALSDLFLFGSTRRLRVLALALATAIAATQLMVLAGLFTIDSSLLYLRHRVDPAAALAGGLLFGLGMVLAGGCASRSVVRSAGGDVRALLVLGLTGVVAVVTAAMLPTQWLPEALGGLDGLRLTWLADPAATAATLMPAAALAGWALAEPRVRTLAELATGIGLGIIVALSWPASQAGASALEAPAAANLMAPWITTAARLVNQAPFAGFGLTFLLAAWVSAAIAAGLGREWRPAGFRDAADLRRHLLGGLAMGLGGGLTLGCTIAHGLSGLAVLAPASVLAVGGMIAGARLALRGLEAGRL